MDDNAEHGIAVSHTKAAQNKLDHAKGFTRQHDWGISHLNERIYGMFIMLVMVILVSVWAFDIQPLIRYAVTIGAGAIFVYCNSMAIKRKKDMDELRKQQVKEHSKRDLGRINQRD